MSRDGNDARIAEGYAMQVLGQGTGGNGAEGFLPDRGFTCGIAAAPGPIVRADQYAGELFHPREPGSDTHWAPVRPATYATIHAYATRRFGLPSYPGDPSEDVSAGWLLTTPDPDVFLRIRPTLGEARFSLLPYLRCRGGDGRPVGGTDPDRMRAVAAAHRVALKDLLRPVPLHEGRINVIGPVGHGDPLALWDGPPEGESPRYQVDYDLAAGIPVPSGILGTAPWDEFTAILSEFGDGNLHDGLSVAVADLHRTVVERILREPANVRIVVAAACARTDPDSPEDDLGLTDAELDVVSDVLEVMDSGGLCEGPIPAFADAELERGERLARLLGGHREVAGPVRHARKVGRFRAEWDRMRSLAGDHIPPELVPVPRRGLTWSPIEKDAAAFVANLRAGGKPEVADWADALAAEEGGREVLHAIVHELLRQVHPDAGKAPVKPPSAGA